MRLWRDRKRGFTLVELVVVFALICLLAGLLLPAFANVLQHARVCRTAYEMRMIASATEVFQATVSNGTFPAGKAGGVGGDSGLVVLGDATAAQAAGWTGPYISTWPTVNAWGGKNTWVLGTAALLGSGGVFSLFDPAAASAFENTAATNPDGVGGNSHWVFFINPTATVVIPTGTGASIDNEFDDTSPSTGQIRQAVTLADLAAGTFAAGNFVAWYTTDGPNAQ